MATLREIFAERAARRARYQEAVERNWRDTFRSLQEEVAEIEGVISRMLLENEENVKKLVEAAGDLDLGPLPAGHHLMFVEEAPKRTKKRSSIRKRASARKPNR